MKKVVLGIVVIILAVGTYFVYHALASPKYNYVTIDINPQIEFALNKNYEVKKVISLNEDGDMLLGGLKLVGLSIEEATKLVLEDAVKMGYIDEFKSKNRIDVTAYADDEAIRQRIEEKVSTASIKYLKEKNIFHSVIKTRISDELKNTANQRKVSYGKILLIEKAYSLDNSLDKEKLMKSSIKEIQEKINKIVAARIKEKKINKEEITKQKEEKIKENEERIKRAIIKVFETNYREYLPKDRDNITEEFLIEAKEKIKQEMRNNPRFDINKFLR